MRTQKITIVVEGETASGKTIISDKIVSFLEKLDLIEIQYVKTNESFHKVTTEIESELR